MTIQRTRASVTGASRRGMVDVSDLGLARKRDKTSSIWPDALGQTRKSWVRAMGLFYPSRRTRTQAR